MINLDKYRTKKLYPLGLVLAFVLLFWLAWPPKIGAPLIFLAFVPLIELVQWSEKKKWYSVFGLLYLAFFLANLMTTWWIANVTMEGAILAIVLNPVFMALPFMGYRYVKKGVKPEVASLCLISFWVAFEYFHLNWALSWPWLTIGNVFAQTTYLVQWYEYTGVLGGTVWVFLINILFFRITAKKGLPFVNGLGVAFLILLAFIFPTTNEDEVEIEGYEYVTVVQPNVDPFLKYDGLSSEAQRLQLLRLSLLEISDSSTLVVWPETALTDLLNEEGLYYNPGIRQIRKSLPRDVQILTGMESWSKIDSIEKNVSTQFNPQVGYYNKFNAALWIGKDTIETYHKSKLVPGAETIPFPGFVDVIKSFLDIPNMGSYTRSDSAVTLKRYAPLICYESIYGEYVGEFVNDGAQLLCIVTNDAWWGNTAGHRQHFQYARLRAIEHRRAIARSANTGISGFIDPWGEVLQETGWYEQTAISARLPLISTKTFYTEHGDFIGRVAAFLSVALLLSGYVKRKAKYTR
jgi:apolipoprotein N-acyltransferase